MSLWAVFLCVALLSQGTNPLAARVDRAAAQRLTIELLIVADYSSFQTRYALTPITESHTARVNEATQNLKQYIAALIHSSNNVYKSLEPHNIYITLKLVDVLVMTTPSDSPWTETVKVRSGSSYLVDPTRALPLFQPKSINLQNTIPHDHAMIFTQYQLTHGGGSSFSGYAYTEAECKQKSVSIIGDNNDFYTSQLIAHEIGHSLGCEHDGNGNSCDRNGGYAMNTNFILANKKKWTFSSCSINYITNYLQDLNTHHRNCLQTIDNSHPDTSVNTLGHEWYGQVYTLDEQCKLHFGQNSYLCRNQYHGDYSNVCLKMFCYDTAKAACYYIDGGDGSPCGTGKWCMSNECVSTAHTGTSVTNDNCAAGDQPGVVYNGRTCQQIIASHFSDCSRSDVMRLCCYSCAHHTTLTTSTTFTTSSTDIDGQCDRRHSGSPGMCRGATAYDGTTYAATVCSDLQCADPNRAHWCLSSSADDKTSCGYKKWCQNGVCVHDNTAPAVPDNCPWGDMKGVAAHGLTCDQISQPEHHWRCYDDFTAKVCCAACNAALRNVNGCEYGDKSDWCPANIRSQSEKRTCYYGHNSDLCCETCNNYRNSAHTNCEFGDKITGCLSSRCSHYHDDSCCETCHSTALVG